MSAASRNLFVVLFPGFELLDAAGPVEIFGNHPDVRVITVAEIKGCPAEGSAKTNIRWAADYSFDEVQCGAAGPIHWVLVPGGIGTRVQVAAAPLLLFLRHAAAHAELVMSVCTGSALLAAAGLLAGRRATSNKRAWAWVTSVTPNHLLWGADHAPDSSLHSGANPDVTTTATATANDGTAAGGVAAGGVSWVYKARWVWDGPIVTSAGVSAGMDMALAVAAKYYGSEAAKELAHYAEYEAHEDPDWDPFSDLYPEPQATRPT